MTPEPRKQQRRRARAQKPKPEPEQNGLVVLAPQEAQFLAGVLANPQVNAIFQTSSLKMAAAAIQQKLGG